MTYGAKKDSALEHFRKAIKLNPDSAIAHIEYAQRTHTADGQQPDRRSDEAVREAAECKPADAMERLDVELARSELE